jgi:vacuolar protein sorting-associated protein 13A/C
VVQISGRTNDIKLALTEYQYSMLMDLVRVLPRAFDNGPSELDVEGQEITMATPAGQLHQDAQSGNKGSTLVERQSIETKGKSAKARTKLEFSFCVPSINLELFDAKAVSRATLHGNSIAKFRMSTAAVTYTNGLDGSVHSEVSLKAITMSNTRAGSSIFREIIPAADYDGYQL